MNLLEALWKSDGRKRPTEKDIKALYDIIQQSEKTMGQEKTFEALLALARFGSLVGFPDSQHPDQPLSIPSSRAPEQLLDVNGVADFLQVSPRTVQNLMKSHVLPYFKIGKIVRFRLPDIVEELKRRQIHGRSNSRSFR